MKFKLSNNEMVALIMLFGELIRKYAQVIEQSKDVSRHIGLLFTYNHTNESSINPAEEMLFLAVFEEMHIKLQQRALLKKDKYNINFSPAQALAFFIEFNGIVDVKTQSGNMVQKMCNGIHQQLVGK